MTIQSLGVGSGLALDDLVQQLLTAERQPKEDRLNAKEEQIEAEISGLGQIKSKFSDFKDAVEKVSIDLSRAHFWDITAISSLDKVVIKFRREGTEVELIGLNEASATLVDKFAVHNRPDAVEKLMGH